jgi:hypothetical protein
MHMIDFVRQDCEASDSMGSLTTAAEQLKCFMSGISERCWSAGWLLGSEFALWEAVIGGTRKWGRSIITDEEIAILSKLADAAEGWIVWNYDMQKELYVPMAEWIDLYIQHNRSHQSAPI